MSDASNPLSSPTLDLRPHPTVAVLGSGTMGQGIVQVVATAGHPVTLFDADPERAAAALAGIGAQLDKLVAKGKMQVSQSRGALASITVSASVGEAVRRADIVIESVPENLDLKVALFKEVLTHAPRQSILASNTSSLSISEIGRRVGAADRTVGLHFFNPPPVMELLEIVRGRDTSDSVIDRSQHFAVALGKSPIVVKDVPGFASSRLGVILGAEAIRMVEAGVASVRDIDRAMELGYRHPMGPLRLTDLVGLDVRLAILEHLTREIGPQFAPPELLRRMVNEGKLGKKTGQGFYTWKDGVAQ